MKYLLKDYRGYIIERTAFIDVRKDVIIEFEFEGGRPVLNEQVIFVLITDANGVERKHELGVDNKVNLGKDELFEGLFAVTVVLVTGSQATRFWRCEPFCLSKLTSAITPLLDVSEMIEATEEIKELRQIVADLTDRVEQLENNYDPRNI